jgi:FixJ family two-component response regulator
VPEKSGLKVQEELVRAAIQVPIIFVAAHGEIPVAVRAMKAGAADFLTKPFRSQELLDAVYSALRRMDSAARPNKDTQLCGSALSR